MKGSFDTLTDVMDTGLQVENHWPNGLLRHGSVVTVTPRVKV